VSVGGIGLALLDRLVAGSGNRERFLVLGKPDDQATATLRVEEWPLVIWLGDQRVGAK
jgi:hypothetical protein